MRVAVLPQGDYERTSSRARRSGGATAPIEIRRAVRQQTDLERIELAVSELPDLFMFDLVGHDRDILTSVTPNDME